MNNDITILFRMYVSLKFISLTLLIYLNFILGKIFGKSYSGDMSLKTPERSAEWEVISVELLGVAQKKGRCCH